MIIYLGVYERIFVLLAFLVLVFALWVAAELYWSTAVRIGVGATAISMCVVLAFVAGAAFQTANANIWFGGVTYALVETSVAELERGRSEAVLGALKRLRDNYRTSDENRANYVDLTRNAIMDMTPPREADEPVEKTRLDE